MKSHFILKWITVSLILLVLVSMVGCSKKDHSTTNEDEINSESAVQATETESSTQTISPLMKQFLSKKVKTRKATAGYQISEFFDFWQDLLHNPRISLEIYFDVELDTKFKRDHIWENKSNREILNELCREYNLTWTITGSDTIKITKKLAIAQLEYKDRTEVVYLANNYGFLIHWLDNQLPKLFVYNKPANSIQVSSDFNIFLKHLKALPSGVQIDRKRGCSITAAGMSEEQKSQLEQVIKEKKFILTDINEGNFTVCTCETIKVTWFTTANQ